jgi:dihydrofolate reductase
MVEIIIIAAVAENNVIGKDGDIPWRISQDFERFKKITLESPCIMGDITYESLPDNARPLPNRENIVLTFNKEYHPDGTTIFHSWEDALEYVKDKEKVFICGGASIYKLGIKVADTFELTRVHKTIVGGDTFFPEVNWDEWKLINEEKYEEYSFLTYKRIKK